MIRDDDLTPEDVDLAHDREICDDPDPHEPHWDEYGFCGGRSSTPVQPMCGCGHLKVDHDGLGCLMGSNAHWCQCQAKWPDE